MAQFKPTSQPAEFRRRAIAPVRSGWSVTKVTHYLDVSSAAIYNLVKQDRSEQGEVPGESTEESTESVKVQRWIRKRHTEVLILRRKHDLLGQDLLRPKSSTRRSTPSPTPSSE